MGERRVAHGVTTLVVVGLVLAGLLSAQPAGSEEAAGTSSASSASEENGGAAISVPAINNASQTSVNDAWIDVMEPAIAVPSGWTGSVAGCNAGTTSQAAYDATFRTINWLREMAGVNQVTENASMRAQLQQTALMMKANGQLSHNPPPEWTCWTQSGRDGSAANLSRGAGFGSGHFDEGFGANAVMSQMRDGGPGNFMVGHRRFNLDPRVTEFGVGFTDDTAAIWPGGDIGEETPMRQPTPLWVPWPSAGFFPAQAEPEGRWSLSAHREADFSAATVTVTPQGGSAFSITPNSDFQFIADNTVVFDFVTPNAIPAPFPNGDPRTYTITVGNIGDRENDGFFPGVTIPSSYTYSVTLFEAEADEPPATTPGVPQGLSAVPGDGHVDLSWSAPASNGGSAITSYRVFRNGTQVHQTANGTTTSFTDTGRTNGQQYSYTVAAVNAVGEGTKTSAVLATPSGGGGPTQTFTDVGSTHPFFADVEWMAAEDISEGYQPGPTYRPSAAVSRQAMSAFMYRLAGSPAFADPPSSTFGDVSVGSTFYTEIEWMASEGITTGTPASPKPLYKPSAAVSRSAMSAFMYRLAGSPTFVDPPSSTFGDVAPGHQFFTEIEWMAAEDITEGTAASPKPLYKPTSAVSRGAMSAFMHRLADGPGVGV
jgi:hypothetical protein